MPILETIELGLGESQELSAIGRRVGISIAGTDGICRGKEVALMLVGITGELVDETVLHVILLSSIALRLGAAENWSYVLSTDPPRAVIISDSDTPRS